MSTFISKIMSFFMSIMYFLASFGIGANDPVVLNITDMDNQPVCGAEIYYTVEGQNESIDYVLIGTTDQNGNVYWENQKYGNQTIVIYNSIENEFPFNSKTANVNISRTSNDTVFIQIDMSE